MPKTGKPNPQKYNLKFAFLYWLIKGRLATL